MKRMHDEFANSCVLAPASVAASTLTTSGFVDAKGMGEVEFLLSAASLANGKVITVGIYTSDAAAGTGAVKVAEKEFTASAAMTKVLISVRYKPKAGDGRYVGLKFKHDSADAVIFSATASERDIYRPAENAWALEA